MNQPIVFWPTERDRANLAIIEAAGLPGEAAIRAAITSLAADCAAVAWALSTAAPTPAAT